MADGTGSDADQTVPGPFDTRRAWAPMSCRRKMNMGRERK